MNKRQAKLEALHIASVLCLSCDGCMWDEDDNFSENARHKVLKAITELGWQLDQRVKRMEQPPKKEKGDG